MVSMDSTNIREVRCQGVILRKDDILILGHYNRIRKQDFWLLPGGGKELEETEEECLVREIKEETNLAVEIIQVLFDEVKDNWGYHRYITYLCRALPGNAEKIGDESNGNKIITELIWLSLKEECPQYLEVEQFNPSFCAIKEKLMELQYLS